MGESLNSEKHTPLFAVKAAALMGIVLIVAGLVLPSLSMAAGWPKVHVSELFLPLMAVLLLFSFKREWLIVLKWPLIFTAVMISVMFFSMAVNSRLGQIRDYFELMKMAKYALLLVFFAAFLHTFRWDLILKVTFILLLLFNVLHYTDFMNFNQTIVKMYGSEVQVDTFGLNSLGQPDTKRILGTVGNPNNNAILFLFFVAYFFPVKGTSLKQQWWFLLAVFAVLACQSRTGFMALSVVYIIGAWLNGFQIKEVLVHAAFFAGFYGLLVLLGNVYLSSLAGNVMKQNSVRGRLETWKFLWSMIKEKPILGYAPNKEFFNKNEIYAENEYILYTWRYGIIGGLLYTGWIFFSWISGWKARMTKEGKVLLMFATVVGITALTNCPLSDAFLLLLFALAGGLFFNVQLRKTVAA